MISFISTDQQQPVPEDQDRRLSTVQKALEASSYPALGRLHCTMVDGVTIVRGVVPSFYLKQVAQSIFMRLGADHSIEHDVVVHNP